MPRRFRYTTPTRQGTWQPTASQARQEAVADGEAMLDEDGRIYLEPLTEIERERVDGHAS
jgi:hypothetical protein